MADPVCVVRLRALGVDVDLRVGGPDPSLLARALRERWHLCLRDEDDAGRPGGEDPAAAGRADLPRPPGQIVLDVALEPRVLAAAHGDASRRDDRSVVDDHLPRLLQRLTQSVTHAVITARTGELLMLHAAGLADPTTGATAVFVAPGNTGKTTLCRTLGPGRAYLTDETVGIRRDGSVEAYPKPLSVRRDDWVGVKDETAPGRLGLRLPAGSPWLAGVVLLTRDPDHPGPPVVEPLGPLDAVIALAPETSGFMSTQAPLRWLSSVLRRTGGARRVTCRQVADLEPLLDEICSRSSPW